VTSIIVISKPSTITCAIRRCLSLFDIEVFVRDPTLLQASVSDGPVHDDWYHASAVVGLPLSPNANTVVETARLTRLRCPPLNFRGPIGVVESSSDLEKVPEEWLRPLGISKMGIPTLISDLLKLSRSRQSWNALPSIDCRPAWALKFEASMLNHELCNIFNILGNHVEGSELDSIEKLQKIMLP
jgi:hypothetical protein